MLGFWLQNALPMDYADVAQLVEHRIRNELVGTKGSRKFPKHIGRLQKRTEVDLLLVSALCQRQESVWKYKLGNCAALAQLVEHVIRNDGVVGSNPIGGTTSKLYIYGLHQPQCICGAAFIPSARGRVSV